MTVESKFMLDKYWKFRLTVSTRGPWRRRILGRRQGWRLRRHSRRRGGRWALGGGRRRYKRRRQWRRRRDSRRSRRRCRRGRGGGDCGGVLPDVPWGGAARAVKRPGRAPRWQHRRRLVVQGIHTFGTSVSPVSFTEPRNRRFSFILRCSLRGTCTSTNSLEARADDSLYRRNLSFTIFLFFFFLWNPRAHNTRSAFGKRMGKQERGRKMEQQWLRALWGFEKKILSRSLFWSAASFLYSISSLLFFRTGHVTTRKHMLQSTNTIGVMA